ncbi:MAG TPA: TetR/AcrR family transcriptional regulator [Solirubrobacteraceae bacterium]|nr:TetR/AcrR family transcriptional regulator [Solirubrobacteraceae bacterium]
MADSAVSAPRWNRLEHDERRAQILTCARRLFSERHFAAVSTAQIAREAGVTRGLVHHYFGAKRALYLEVVRDLVRLPAPTPLETTAGSLIARVDTAIDRWLTMVERNRETWLAALGAEGFGRDADVEAILEEAREVVAERLGAGLGLHTAGEAGEPVRAAVHAFTGMAEAASREWLEHDRLSRGQVHTLLTQTLLTVVHDIIPRLREDSP